MCMYITCTRCVQILAPAAGPGPHPKCPSPGSIHGQRDKLSGEAWPCSSGYRCHPSPPSLGTPGPHACPGCGLAVMYAPPAFNITPVEPPPPSGTFPHRTPHGRW
ncbi:hypothetical protein BT67DRAFT_277480 [Trichocladium antarcticum]|uniref:Uncharacterized protein n=1 Tax=Trichocladium antarcticum TaxID=1450529 RepID=A0AAN6ZFE1_9PEZI|nr:hypothetical protein BT67DRAFT_277480 [Trichocladium antarcticum]